MSKTTLALILGLIGIAVLLLVVALRPIMYPSTPIQETETPNEATEVSSDSEAQTTLAITPNPITLSASRSGSVDIIVDSYENEVTAIQLEIGYDPEVLTNIQISPAEFFPNPITILNIIDEETGRITYALGVTPAQSPIKGEGIVARLTFQTLPGVSVNESRIELLSKSLVMTGDGTGQSVLKSTEGTVVIFPQQQIFPSPTTTTDIFPTVAPTVPVQ